MIARSVTLVLTVALLLCGCGLDLHDVPMPRLVDGPTRTLTAEFESALNLPVESPVKLDGRIVGQVEAIDVVDYRARVRMAVSTAVTLHEGTRAEIRLTSPMGTAFVELVDGRRSALLATDAVLGPDATTRAPDVADLLSSLSVVVTGGSFADVKTIVDELNVALGGNAPVVRSLMGRLNRVVTDLNAHTASFDAALDAVDRLSGRLAADAPVLVEAIRAIDPAVRALGDQRADLMRLLDTVHRLAGTGKEVIPALRDDLVATLEHTGPVLAALTRNRENLNRTMRGLIEFGRRTDAASPGDFSNFDLTLLLDPQGLDPAPGQPEQPRGGGR
ncbi:MCE family protein [Nocardioides daejeonensis]|uniref:MCE family protein n=1 Tax=Nocardioides daejeonensis TaxID=1046556 RepID=UPI000D74BFAD|nr:MCE family protein [Nocardioides daejeonensis]